MMGCVPGALIDAMADTSILLNTGTVFSVGVPRDPMPASLFSAAGLGCAGRAEICCDGLGSTFARKLALATLIMAMAATAMANLSKVEPSVVSE